MFLKQASSFALLLCFSSLICVSKGLFNCPSNYSILEVGMSYEDRMTVLNAHNDARRKIATGAIAGQPKACDMAEMSYDMGLEVQARKLVAETCKFAHVKITDGRWFAVGQNLYLWRSSGNTPKPNWPTAVSSWFDEYKLNYTYPGQSSVTGHYTQVVWSTSTCLGCSYIYYKNPADKFSFSKFYVCNYGPAGNIQGQAPYQIKCPTQCTLKNGLCVTANKCSGASAVSDFSMPNTA